MQGYATLHQLRAERDPAVRGAVLEAAAGALFRAAGGLRAARAGAAAAGGVPGRSCRLVADLVRGLRADLTGEAGDEGPQARPQDRAAVSSSLTWCAAEDQWYALHPWDFSAW